MGGRCDTALRGILVSRDSRTCFETAMVNEPSEFKPLKVNCIFIDIRGYFEISVLKTSFVCLYKLSLLVR